MVSIRSASMACRNAPTSKTGMITAVPPTYRATSSWLLQPVTWNSGTEIRVRRPAGIHGERPAAGLGVGQEVLVAGHRALGEAGRAAGVEDRGRAGRLGVVDDQRVAVGQRGSGHERVRRAGVGHHVVRFLLGEARVDRHHDRVGQHGAEEGQHPVDAVAEPDRHPVAALDAEAAQAARHPGRAVPQRGVAQPRAAAGLHHRLGGAVLVDRGAEHLHQVAGQAFVALDAVLAADDAGHVEHAAQVAVVRGAHDAPSLAGVK